MAAAFISLGGSAVFAGCGILYRKLKNRKTINHTKFKNKILVHRLFVIHKTVRPIVIDFDDVRTKLFQHIQFEILCTSIQDIVRTWIDASYISLFVENTEPTSNSYQLMANEIVSNITESEDLQSKIDDLPKPLEKLTNVLIQDFFYEIKCMFDSTHFDALLEEFDNDLSHKTIVFYNQILDLIHTVILITISKWNSISHQINGSLNGIEWQGNTISYICYNEVKWTTYINNLWNMLTQAGLIVPSKYCHTTVSTEGDFHAINAEFKTITGYGPEIIGENLKILRCGLSYNESMSNYNEDARHTHRISSHESFIANFTNYHKITQTSYDISMYANPILFSSQEPSPKMYWILMHLNGEIDQRTHTLSSMILQLSMTNSYVITCTTIDHALQKNKNGGDGGGDGDLPIDILEAHNVSETNILHKLKTVRFLDHIDISKYRVNALIEQAKRNVDIMTDKSQKCNEDLVDSQTFAYYLHGQKIMSTLWYFEHDSESPIQHIVIVHRNPHVDINFESSFTTLKPSRKYSENYSKA